MYTLPRILMVSFVLWSSSAFLDRSKFGKLAPIAVELHDLCTDITGATNDMIDQLRHGNFIENKTIKRYILCLWRASRVLDTHFQIHGEVLEGLMPDSIKPTHMFDEYEDCYNRGKNSGSMWAYLPGCDSRLPIITTTINTSKRVSVTSDLQTDLPLGDGRLRFIIF